MISISDKSNFEGRGSLMLGSVFQLVKAELYTSLFFSSSSSSSSLLQSNLVKISIFLYFQKFSSQDPSVSVVQGQAQLTLDPKVPGSNLIGVNIFFPFLTDSFNIIYFNFLNTYSNGRPHFKIGSLSAFFTASQKGKSFKNISYLLYLCYSSSNFKPKSVNFFNFLSQNLSISSIFKKYSNVRELKSYLTLVLLVSGFVLMRQYLLKLCTLF